MTLWVWSTYSSVQPRLPSETQSQRNKQRVRIHGSAVKSTWCSSRGSGSDSQHPHAGSLRFQWIGHPLPAFAGTDCMRCIFIHVGKSPIHRRIHLITIFLKIKFSPNGVHELVTTTNLSPSTHLPRSPSHSGTANWVGLLTVATKPQEKKS